MMKHTTKSCIHLQRSIYLAPDEVRACCQRFFVDGVMKGDVVLIKLDGPGKISYEEVLSKKQTLLSRINSDRGDDSPCSGCPHLVTQEWPPLEEESLGTLSIENHSLCNMKCSYCSERYYGGVEPQYELTALLDGVERVGDDLHIAWGGGEPTARKDFDRLFRGINRKFSPNSQIIFTNALKYSPVIQQALDRGEAAITTSIDAGTESTFQKVRGSKGMDKVLRHLQKYASKRPDRVTIKYIFTAENYSLDEVEPFVENLQAHELLACNFLISADFTSETVDQQVVLSVIQLFFLLYQKKSYFVSFDDHVYYRVREIGAEIALLFEQNGLSREQIALYENARDQLSRAQQGHIVLWGTGEFSTYLLRSSKAIQRQKITLSHVVDGAPEKWGTAFMGYRVESPEAIDYESDYVVVASSNYYGEIVHRLLSEGLSIERIIPNFIL